MLLFRFLWIAFCICFVVAVPETVLIWMSVSVGLLTFAVLWHLAARTDSSEPDSPSWEPTPRKRESADH